VPVVKLFTPDAGCTWLLTEIGRRDTPIGPARQVAPRVDMTPDASRQKIMRSKQPHQLRGPFTSLRHFPGISEGEGLRQGLVER
jgi:hypothetical protein